MSSVIQELLKKTSDLQLEIPPGQTPDDAFETIKTIGKGGYGSVLLIKHKPSGTLVAGKTIESSTLTDSAAEGLLKEIELLKKIVTPYTIKYYGNVLYHGSPMIMMEYCDRGSLRDMIDYRNVCLTEKEASIIIHDLLSCLLILHSKFKILHRDIKSANILLTSKQQIRVTDFGVSRDFSQGGASTISSIGTPYWMAPEVIFGIPYSYPADVWSVGATAIELVEGAPPYCELEPARAMAQIGKRGFPGFRSPTTVSEEFKDFIGKVMERDPAKRPQIPVLLKHPWVAQSDSLNRNEVLKSLTETEIDMDKLNAMLNETGEEGTDQAWISTARKTLRK